MERSVTRRLNFTQRLDIPASDVEIDVRAVSGSAPRVVVLRLGLPESCTHPQDEWDSALVVLEAWRSDASAYARFQLGRVAEVRRKSPPLLSEPLAGFPDEHAISFRVKVISAQAKILAEADHLRAQTDSRHQDELISVLPKDLDELPWTIDWSDPDEGPVIHVNERMYDHRTFLTRDPVTSALVLPTVLREVLHRVAADREARETTWGRRWIDFASRMSTSPMPDEDDDEAAVDDWVLGALHEFSRRHLLASAADEHMKQHQEEPAR